MHTCPDSGRHKAIHDLNCFCCWLGGGSCPLDRRADKRTWGRFYQGRNVAHAARASERGATPNLACSLRVGGVSDLSWTDSRTRVCRLIRHPSAQTSFPFEERRIDHKIVCHPRLMQGNLPIGPPKACRTHFQLLFASDEQDGGETALGVGEGSSDLGQQ